jgi:hypothetical protein
MSHRTPRIAPVLVALALAVAGTGIANAKGSGRNPPFPAPQPKSEPVTPFSLSQIWERFGSWLAS